jgi:hypothetical protein
MLLEGESTIRDVSFALVLISIVSCGMCNQKGDSTPLECRIFFLRLRTESLRARTMDVEVLARLVTRLEHERSLAAFIQFGEALRYTVQVEEDVVWVDHPLSRWMAIYFQTETLVADLLGTGKAELEALAAGE